MVSTWRIAALLGFTAIARANGPDCQYNNCANQMIQNSRQASGFCATYTTAVVTQTTDYPEFIANCHGNPVKISSACSCVAPGNPPPPNCHPSTITVTFTPPFQTHTTTENITITQYATVTTDIYIPTTVISDVSVTETDTATETKTETETDTTTTEKDITTTTTLVEVTTETDTATTTKISISVSESDITIDVPTTITETDTVTTSTPFDVPTTITDTDTVTTSTPYEVIVPTTTTTTSITTSVITTSFPVTTTVPFFTTITDTTTGPPLTFTSFITEVSWSTTVLTTTFSATATETVPSPFPVTQTETDIGTTTDVEIITLPASIITTSISGSLTTITEPGSTVTNIVVNPTTTTAPAQTKTLPGITSIETITTVLPGVLTTVTAAGVVTTITLPGVTSVITTTVTLPGILTTLPGIPTTFPPETITVTNGIVTCPGPTPTTQVATALPTDFTWGCAPGTVCHPPKPQGCDVFAEPPPVDYVCQPSECVPAPSFTRVTKGWGNSTSSNNTSFYPLQGDYFNLSPLAFGLSFDIFTENIKVVNVPGGQATITTGDWSSQATITSQPTPDVSGLSAKRAKRSIFRRSTVPAPCYNECNNCYIEAQQEGKTPALCQMTPTQSPFMQDLAGCKACVAAHGDTTQQSLKAYVDPEFAQYLDFCQGQAAQSATAPSSTPVQSEISPGPTVIPSVVSQSQQAPVSSTPPVATSTPSPTPTPTPTPTPAPNSPSPVSSATSEAEGINSSSAESSSTSTAPPSATTSFLQVTGRGSRLDPAGIFILALTAVFAAFLPLLI